MTQRLRRAWEEIRDEFRRFLYGFDCPGKEDR